MLSQLLPERLRGSGLPCRGSWPGAGAKWCFADLQVKLVQQVAQEIRKEGGTGDGPSRSMLPIFPQSTDWLRTRSNARGGWIISFNNAGIGVGGADDGFQDRRLGLYHPG